MTYVLRKETKQVSFDASAYFTVVKRMSVPSGTYNPTWRAPRMIKFYKRLIPLLKIVSCLYKCTHVSFIT